MSFFCACVFFCDAIHDWYGMCFLVELNVNLDRSNFSLTVRRVLEQFNCSSLLMSGHLLPQPCRSHPRVLGSCSHPAPLAIAPFKNLFFKEKSRWRFRHNATDLHTYKLKLNKYVYMYIYKCKFYKCYGCFGRPSA